jgi:hypothetical protein
MRSVVDGRWQLQAQFCLLELLMAEREGASAAFQFDARGGYYGRTFGPLNQGMLSEWRSY